MNVWRSLLLIYDSIDVKLRNRSGSSQSFTHLLTDTELSDGVNSFQQFPLLVEELTSRRATILYEIHRVERCLTSLTHMSEGMYWPSPTDTRKEIDRLAAPGSYESIFVLWPQKEVEGWNHAATRSSDGGVFDGGGNKAVEADAGCAVDAESLVYDGAETMG